MRNQSQCAVLSQLVTQGRVLKSADGYVLARA
jgi:hypothetical protein